MPHRRHVDLHGLTEGVEVFVLDGDLVPDTGVVDEDVDRTGPFEHLGHETLAVVGARQVGRDGQRARQLLDERVETVTPPRRHDHRGTSGVEHPGEALAEPGRGARHHGHPAIEAEQRQRVERGPGR
jgi:hypothetical protein